MVIHSGSNDITNKVNILRKIRKVKKAIIENNVNDETAIILSSVIHRDDQYIEDEINELKKILENLCKRKSMGFIDNSNIKSSSLNRSKLHLNKSGTALLTKNFIFSYLNINSIVIVINLRTFVTLLETMWTSSQLQRQNFTLHFRMHSSYYLAFMRL